MSQLSGTVEFGTAVKLNVQRTRLTKEQFALLCQENRDLRFELTAQQELVIMPPAGSETGRRNSKLNLRLAIWAETQGTGLTFGSSTGFTLPNGAIRSPDASWIRQERWNALTKEQRVGFAPICPDFVVELRSPSDRLSELQDKMQEYLANGARLGWLIDPIDKRVEIYRPGQPVETRDNPATVSGDPVLPGFVLPVHELW
jgi:Uma2 family endonuclease